MTYQTIEVTIEAAIAEIRLNRPDKMNSITRELMAEVQAALETLAADDGVRVVIISGAGRCFCSGFDISGDGSGQRRGVMEWKDHSRVSQDFMRRLWNFPKPLIAAVHSYALGGGCEIAMLCDLTIAADDAVFGEPEIRFGTGSPTLIMPWVVPLKIAKELLYTGKAIDAQRAKEIGMVNEVVPVLNLKRRARYHARLLAQVDPLAVRLMKEALNKTFEIMGLHGALANAENLVAILDGTESETGREFAQIREKSGLKAALRWQEEQYRKIEEIG